MGMSIEVPAAEVRRLFTAPNKRTVNFLVNVVVNVTIIADHHYVDHH